MGGKRRPLRLGRPANNPRSFPEIAVIPASTVNAAPVT